MNEFDDIFTSVQTEPEPAPEEPFDLDAWKEKKQTDRQQVYDMADDTTMAVSTNGEYFRDYLDVQAQFPRYSVTNAMLILAQNPEATLLKDFDTWKDAGLHIRKGAEGISILEPGNSYVRGNGSIGKHYNVKRVFDISQTSPPPRAYVPAKVDDRTLLKALAKSSPIPIRPVDELPTKGGAIYDPTQQVILLRKGMDAPTIFISLSKEIAHAEIARNRDGYSRDEASFAAYSASYILCRQHNIPVDGYNFTAAPVALATAIEGVEPEKAAAKIRETLTEVRDTANSVSRRLDHALEQAKPPRDKSDQER